MTKLQHILVPIDGSENSLKAAAFGGNLANLLDAQLTILLIQDERSVVSKAWDTPAGASNLGSELSSTKDARATFEQASIENELAAARNASGEVSKGINVAQIWGHPARDICSYAAENDVDLIVMGSHGRTGLKKLLLGSVSHAVVNTANCAVTVVR